MSVVSIWVPVTMFTVLDPMKIRFSRAVRWAYFFCKCVCGEETRKLWKWVEHTGSENVS